MTFDLLCSGTWQDSYESRFVNEMVWNREVNDFNTVLLLIHQYFTPEIKKQEMDLWGKHVSFSIYIDGSLIGDYYPSTDEIKLFPITDYQDIRRNGKLELGYTFRHGRNCWYIPVTTCLNYGINRKTVRKGEAW